MTEETKNSPYDSFQRGDRVKHPKFGEGQIVLRSGVGDETKLEVTFQEEGDKRLMARYAKLKKLSPIESKAEKEAPVKEEEPEETDVDNEEVEDEELDFDDSFEGAAKEEEEGDEDSK